MSSGRPIKTLLFALLATAALFGQDFRAGVGRALITPSTPVWLAGFAARTKPAESIGLDLYAKALALEDGRGNRVIIVSADLLGVTREITEEVARRVAQRHGLRREQILFNASHTHSGPEVWPGLRVAPVESAENNARVKEYGRFLMDQFEAVIGQTIGSLQPASISYSFTEARFATNRRKEQLAELRPGEIFPAPVDPRVPVVRVSGRDGSVRAVLFGYACHNTVLTADTNEISGDYAGYAQKALENEFPGSTAVFLILCGGDQRPAPRGSRELAIKHGEALAADVAKVVRGEMAASSGELKCAIRETQLRFQTHTRESYVAEAQSSDLFAARRGRTMLEAIAGGQPIRSTQYPAQAMALGRDLVLLALGGEVVVDYSLRFAREYPDLKLIVAGYSNDVMGYIPSQRVWMEGGYEAGDAMMYFNQPGWFTPDVEDKVTEAAHGALKDIGFSCHTCESRKGK